MYPVNVRRRFTQDFVVGMGEAPCLSGDMLSSKGMLNGFGVLGASKKRSTPEQIAAALAARQAAKLAALERRRNLAAEQTVQQKALLAERRARAEELALQKRKQAVELAAGVAAEKAKLRATYMSQLQEAAAGAGYPPEEVAALLQGRGFKGAVMVLKKLSALRARKDVKNYKESIKSLTEGGALPLAADAAASADTGLSPETPMAAAMMPTAPYSEQEEGLPAYAQGSVEAAAEAAQPDYSLPYSDSPAVPPSGDDDVVSPEEVEGAQVDTGSQPRTGITSDSLSDEDLADQEAYGQQSSDIVAGPMDGFGADEVTPGLPNMSHAGADEDIQKLIDEEAGAEDEMSVEESRKRYPPMLVEEEEIGWPSKIGEGAENGWYGSDPALTSSESVGGDISHTPASMRQRVIQMESAASVGLSRKPRNRKAAMMLNEGEALLTGAALQEQRTRVAAASAAAMTREVIAKHRNRAGGAFGLGSPFGLGSTPFGAQFAVQSAVSAVDSREKALSAADPTKLESLRRLNAGPYADMQAARAILEGPSVAITDELAAVAKFTVAAATYKASLDNTLQALRPKKTPKLPISVAAALPSAVKETVFSKYGMWVLGGGAVLVGGLLVLNMYMKRKSK